MDRTFQAEYRRYRALGWLASNAFRAAKVRVAWLAAERKDLVKLDCEPEFDFYDDSYVDTWDISEAQKEREKKAIAKRIDLEGCWILVGYYRVSKDSPWESADSVGGFIGDDWRDSGYDIDIMANTLAELESFTRPGTAETMACDDA